MKEKSLLKVALVCSLVGVTVLFFISEFIEVEERDIDEITIDDLDKNVKIIGTVSKVVDTDKVVIMDITQPQKLKVMLFKDEEINLKKGNYIEVLGKVQEYEGELEIIGDRIRLIN
ncbi:hypothetical protein KY360_06280 [Candidatus Woesearchaeota archaeon]|nr:hypothetical protein [Candidatus Woesearchaeota archaeon]